MLCVSGVDEGGIPAWGRRITVRFFGGESRAGRNYPDPDGSVPEIRFRMRSTWGVFRTHAICTEWIEYRTDAQVKTIAAPITTTRRPFQRIRNWRKLSGAVSPIFAQQYYEILTAHRFIQMSGATGRRQDATDAPWRLVRAALQLAHSGRPGRVDIRAPQVGVRRRRLPALSLHSVGRICLHIIPFLRPPVLRSIWGIRFSNASLAHGWPNVPSQHVYQGAPYGRCTGKPNAAQSTETAETPWVRILFSIISHF